MSALAYPHRLARRLYEVYGIRATAGDPLTPPARLHNVGGGDFGGLGDEYLRIFRDLADLEPTDRVLDVGCGVGRMARPLTRYLGPDGSYDGFDVVEVAIRWCQRHYEKSYPNFHFKWVNLANGTYNPAGTASAEQFSFPYADDSFDFVLLTSVFTHMLPEAVERYAAEIARVLAPSGRCLLTFFLLNDESRRLIADGRSTQAFADVTLPYAVVNAKRLEDAVAYEELWALSMLEHAGLHPRLPVEYGSWCGRETFTHYQDILLADRREPTVS